MGHTTQSFLKKLRRDHDSASSDKQDDEQAALTELYCGEQPEVDIVAVHGLNGNALKTFTAKTAERSWLEDESMLPRDISNCRVLTYSYPASVATVLGSTSSDRILQHAHTLVAELVADRQLSDATERPIIFICHSLGGIIVKRALVYSASRTSHMVAHLHSIFTSTHGILFLGTPHLGSDRVNLATFAQRIVDLLVPSKLIDTDSQLLDALEAGSEVLQDITDNFVPLMKRFRISFFWEQEKTDFGVKWDYVVTENSAAPILDNTDRAGLMSDHRNMCKFSSRSAPGYRLVMATLRRYAAQAPMSIAPRWDHSKAILLSMRHNEAQELLSNQTVGSNNPSGYMPLNPVLMPGGLETLQHQSPAHPRHLTGSDAELHEPSDKALLRLQN